jgi:hypothetical protein
MNRFDIPSIITKMIDKAIEIQLIDASDVLALGSTHGENWAGLVDEIVNYAYSNIHVNDDHDIICRYSDAFHVWNSQRDRMTKTDKVEIPEGGTMDFDFRFDVFFKGCIQIHNESMATTFPNLKPDTFSYTVGKRYVKVIRDHSVHCFVDKTNGDVLKAASWSAPAKHARGNIYDDANGLGSMGEYGPAYLR